MILHFYPFPFFRRFSRLSHASAAKLTQPYPHGGAESRQCRSTAVSPLVSGNPRRLCRQSGNNGTNAPIPAKAGIGAAEKLLSGRASNKKLFSNLKKQREPFSRRRIGREYERSGQGAA
ncbi:hypothetical protein DPQ25_04715 [Hydrogeniiclostridium mannosilyticum]|uniref:Uncharacterized protein n=1 Tax=Hydrogeniiclostridium mannosilyticum TaxID=2764322 RepID=A0A328UPJ3_9FIRM|nr:hypothetical protein DPQ25_04715 [Hydrogeniiclostridium mannosilyticum]